MTRFFWIILLIIFGALLAKFPKGTWKVSKVFFIADSIIFWTLFLLDNLGIIDVYTFI